MSMEAVEDSQESRVMNRGQHEQEATDSGQVFLALFQVSLCPAHLQLEEVLRQLANGLHAPILDKGTHTQLRMLARIQVEVTNTHAAPE